jgi:SSS family solute:Na+ symporter
VIGLTAKALPEFNVLGPKLAAPAMLLELLPPWLVVLLLSCFLAAILSSFAMTALCPATILANDIYKRLYKQDADEARMAWVTRAAIIALAFTAMAVASYLPPILAAIAWVNGWLIPILWLFIAGLFWRHSSQSAAITISVTWAVNSLWSFTALPHWLGLEKIDNTYIVVSVTLVVGIVSSLLFGDRPAYIKTRAYQKRVEAYA